MAPMETRPERKGHAMTRPQRRLHLVLWIVLAAAITLTVRHAVDTRAATWGALETNTFQAETSAP